MKKQLEPCELSKDTRIMLAVAALEYLMSEKSMHIFTCPFCKKHGQCIECGGTGYIWGNFWEYGEKEQGM